MKFPKLKNKLILAPMEDISNLPFRLLCRKYGCSLAYTQQVSSLALLHNNQKTINLIETNKQDSPVGLQVFGRNPEAIIEATSPYLKNFDILDLNFGCPSKKIVAQGYGSALLKEKDTIYNLISGIKDNIKVPLTVKMRSGFKENEALQLVKVIEEAGACAITIHARTALQGYSGKADWNIIKEVKESVSIPVIGNGDITSPFEAERMLDETKCDYVMIARAAMNNPFIFKQTLHYFKTNKILKQTDEEKVNLFFEYLSLDKNPNLATLKLMAHNFSSGINGSSKLREQITHAKSIDNLVYLMKEFKDNLYKQSISD